MSLMRRTLAVRRSIALMVVIALMAIGVLSIPDFYVVDMESSADSKDGGSSLAIEALDKLEVKGRAPKTGYQRSQFGGGWSTRVGCDVRNMILRRDLSETVINEECQVTSGFLDDPYTGTVIRFQRGSATSQAVQIDHVVALSDAWQKGAQQLSFEERVLLANDPLELLAVSGQANQQKGDGDAATWLPPNRPFRCQYVARQIAVKKNYKLWVTQPEKDAMIRVLSKCPGQRLPVDSRSNHVVP